MHASNQESINKDNKIYIRSLALIAENFGKTWTL